MGTVTTPSNVAKSEGQQSPDRDIGQEGLVTSKGTTTIADAVVSKIAEMAAREVRGVHDLSGGIGGTLRRLAPGMDERGSGASVEVGRKEAIIELDVVVDYGVSIPQLAQQVRANVTDRIEHMTGLMVKEVNIDVSDLYFAEEERRRSQERVRQETPRVE